MGGRGVNWEKREGKLHWDVKQQQQQKLINELKKVFRNFPPSLLWGFLLLCRDTATTANLLKENI